jgi:2,4-dichlorophenol 6-monooxygenase
MQEQALNPVTIIGAGPAGLVTSLLLSQYEIPHVLIEKYRTMAHTPRAHIINQRTVEIFRQLGLEEEFSDVAMPWNLMTNTVWHTSLTGVEVGRRRSWGNPPERRGEYIASSPCEMANCGQHLLEPLLLKHAKASPWADVRLGQELTELVEHAGHVEAVVRDRDTGERSTVLGRYLVGADGGRSVVAAAIGMEYEGREGLAHSATIHFHADLSRYTSYRPGTLYWNVAPGSADFRGLGNLICHQPWHDWALVFSYDPDELDPHDRAAALDRLRKIIGDDDVEIDILNIGTWTINRIVGKNYSTERIFCMGDAVHRHPPTNGLGLNTSVADAFNLAWKLAHAVRGVAGPALLPSYSAERQPVGVRIVNRAYNSIGDMRPIAEALGFEDGQSEEDGRAEFAALYAPGERGEAKRKALLEAIARTDHQFNAHGVELGYVYDSEIVIGDGTPPVAPGDDPDLYYHPTTRPGASLPHAWLTDGERHMSTHDIAGRGRFTLITGIGGEPWAEVVADAVHELRVPVDIRTIGTTDGLVDCYGDWARLRHTSESGCVLVRPDLHIAWRAPDASPSHLREFRTVLAMAIGRPSREMLSGDRRRQGDHVRAGMVNVVADDGA